MRVHADEALPGRSGITDKLFIDCIRRPADEAAHDLPLIVLLGTRGSGKTWVLKSLRNACRRSVAIPYTFLDCADPPGRSVWKLITDLADALHAQNWKEFGRLNFPRVTLGRLAAEHPQLPPGNLTAEEMLLEGLRAKARLKARSESVGDLVTDVSQALDRPQPIIRLLLSVLAVLRRVAESPHLVRYVYRTGLQWYGIRFGPSEHSGLSALVELNRYYHSDDGRASQMLCEALVEDLNQAFARKRKFNCAVLLDNCDHPAGTGFLSLLAELRSGHSGCDPMVVVATSRTVPHLTGLDREWVFPWEPDRSGASRMPGADTVDYSTWRDNHISGDDQVSRWCPVHLRDLTLSELRRDFVRHHLNHHDFVHRLTSGHPWSARRVTRAVSSGALPARLGEDELLDIPAAFARQAAEYLLADLAAPLREKLVHWSAARDVDTAATVLGDGGKDLRRELETRLWLVRDLPLPRRAPGNPRIHPWLRRILLRELAATPADWSWAHRKLRDHAVEEHRPLDAAYHALACRELSPAVEHLAGQFDITDADSWIGEFEAVTDAPGAAPGGIPVERHETLELERGPRNDAPLTRRDRVRNTLWSMVAARWIWSDQLGDPKATLKDTIADGFVRLADENPAGSARYRREARAYREKKAW
ncbi:MAG: hypothetical protein ACRDRV_03780 [Pseudonocardiaceae bacterium]